MKIYKTDNKGEKELPMTSTHLSRVQCMTIFQSKTLYTFCIHKSNEHLYLWSKLSRCKQRDFKILSAQYMYTVLLANFTKKKKQLKASEKLIFPPMLMICLYVPGILSIEGVQSLGFALNLEASPPVGGYSIVSVDGHRFVKSVRWYRRLLRGTVDTKQHFINSAVHRFEKQNNLISLCWSTVTCNITSSFVSMV